MATVQLKSRTLSDGRESFYLDIMEGKERKRITLGIYLDGGKHDEMFRELAEEKRAEMVLRIHREGIFWQKRKTDFIRYCDVKAQHLKYHKRLSLVKHLRDYNEYFNEDRLLGFDDITPDWWLGFKRYLESLNHKHNTVQSLLMTLKAFLNDAITDKIIFTNPLKTVKMGRVFTAREYLTASELKRLAVAECPNELVKMAFLFGCYTGLRLSDIRTLTRDKIVNNTITVGQHKTGETVIVNLNATARAILDKLDDSLFQGLTSNSTINYRIKNWVANAGIGKNISFHTSRHTFATMLITSGAAMHTVQKLLGHTDIGTTQFYAKVLDPVKQKAVDALPGLDI